jgi:hypothetical protein
MKRRKRFKERFPTNMEAIQGCKHSQGRTIHHTDDHIAKSHSTEPVPKTAKAKETATER